MTYDRSITSLGNLKRYIFYNIICPSYEKDKCETSTADILNPPILFKRNNYTSLYKKSQGFTWQSNDILGM